MALAADEGSGAKLRLHSGVVAALAFLAAIGGTSSTDRAPQIIVPRAIFADDIVVWGLLPLNAPITESISEPPIDLLVVTDGLVAGQICIPAEIEMSDRAWEDAAKRMLDLRASRQ